MQEGQPPSEPQRLEDVDPAVLAEIEAEFAAITQEIQRISAMPRSSGTRKAEMLKAIRGDWEKRAAERSPDRPEWRKRLDAALDQAIDKMLVDSLVDLPDGSVAFQLNSNTMQSEAPPLLKALLDGIIATWQEKLKPAPGQAPSPFAGIVTSLGQVLAQAFSAIKLPTPGGATGTDATGAPSAEGAAQPVPTKIDVGFEQPIEAHVKLATNQAPVVTLDAGAGPVTLTDDAGASSPTATPTPPTEPAPTTEAPQSEAPKSDVGRDFFAALMGGLGQVLQRSFAKPPEAAPAAAPPPPPTSGTPAPTTDAPAPVAPEAPAAPAPPSPALEAAPALPLDQGQAAGPGPAPTIKIDLQGLLGQLLQGLNKPPRK